MRAHRLAAEVLRRSEQQAALGRMVAGLSHELRNPLAAIQGLSNVLTSECAPDDARFEPARRIGELVTRMEKLIAMCVEAGNPPPPHLETANAADLAARALEETAAAHAWLARPTLTVEGQRLTVRADVEQILKCVRAVVENACDAAGDPAAVEVRVRADWQRDHGPACALIEVLDRGPGIPGSLLPRVFEPFYTTKPDRLGLGLALAQALALRNGATLDVTSQPGLTIFTLALPLEGDQA
jgi:two-component system, NtrC family, sensor histidine kinase HydH